MRNSLLMRSMQFGHRQIRKEKFQLDGLISRAGSTVLRIWKTLSDSKARRHESGHRCGGSDRARRPCGHCPAANPAAEPVQIRHISSLGLNMALERIDPGIAHRSYAMGNSIACRGFGGWHSCKQLKNGFLACLRQTNDS